MAKSKVEALVSHIENNPQTREEVIRAVEILQKYLNPTRPLAAKKAAKAKYAIKPRASKPAAAPTTNTAKFTKFNPSGKGKRKDVIPLGTPPRKNAVKQGPRVYAPRPNNGLRQALEHLMKKANTSYMFANILSILRKDYNLPHLTPEVLDVQLAFYTNKGLMQRFVNTSEEIRFRNREKGNWFPETEKTKAVLEGLKAKWACTAA